jgi:GNAT superfamily N-acetyltransferase
MDAVITAHASEAALWTMAPGLDGRDAGFSAGDAMDLCVGVRATDGVVRARAGLWWREPAPVEGERAGCIGAFEAADADAAARLLDGACAELRNQGCRVAVGPMNGNTWRRYRLVIDRGERPRFLLEPWNPPEYPGWWLAAGFRELATYHSARVPLLANGEKLTRVRARLEQAGVTSRALRMEAFTEELRAIHRVSLEAFAGNFLYTPQSETAFLEQYERTRGRVAPELVRLAEVDGAVCGFAFGIADALNAVPGSQPDLIIKTLAVRPERRLAGLGSLLIEELGDAARAAGFTHAIHALQHEQNSSRRITSRHHGVPLRRYALYQRRLDPR